MGALCARLRGRNCSRKVDQTISERQKEPWLGDDAGVGIQSTMEGIPRRKPGGS